MTTATKSASEGSIAKSYELSNTIEVKTTTLDNIVEEGANLPTS